MPWLRLDLYIINPYRSELASRSLPIACKSGNFDEGYESAILLPISTEYVAKLYPYPQIKLPDIFNGTPSTSSCVPEIKDREYS
jgi:hypothetical protein